MRLRATAMAIVNSVMQAVAGSGTQQDHLRAKLSLQNATEQPARFPHASTQILQVMAGECGQPRLSQFNIEHIATWDH